MLENPVVTTLLLKLYLLGYLMVNDCNFGLKRNFFSYFDHNYRRNFDTLQKLLCDGFIFVIETLLILMKLNV